MKTTYKVNYYYGGFFGGTLDFNTLKEAWQFFKEHKNYIMADGADIIRIIKTKKHVWSKENKTTQTVISWAR